MKKTILMASASLTLVVTGCGNDRPAGEAPAAKTADRSIAASTTSTDPEFEKLKGVTPVDACAWLTPQKLAVVFPDLKFDVHQKLAPQLSGYTWDSRCVYWAGVGSIDFAKDAPTHTVEIFVNTVVSAEKAQANLASRMQTAQTATGFQAQAAFGPSAYAVTNTGIASLYFVKGQSEVQINFSDLKTPNQEKIKKALAIAQAL